MSDTARSKAVLVDSVRALPENWPPVKIIVTSGQHVVKITDMPEGSVFFSKPYAHGAILQSMRELLSE